MKDIHNKAKALQLAMVAIRRDLHRYPETGWLEFRTAAMAAKRMLELGYTVTMGEDAVSKKHMMGVPAAEVLRTARDRALSQGADPGLVARMGDGMTGFWADMQFGDGTGPCIALRFDMDANDVCECRDIAHRPTQEGFASVVPGAMHACGHDAHTAIGLGVAEIVAGMKDSLKGTVRFIFQAAEEGGRGALPMVEAGCVEGVNAILGMHIGFQAAKKGDLICGGTGFLASTKWDVAFTGKSAHAGAAPQEGKNALLAACAAVTNLHAIPRHGDGATRINVGKMEGGQGRNVIPPNAWIALETRGLSSPLNEYMKAEADRIIKAAAAMWDCSYKTTLMGFTPSGESDPGMIEKVRHAASGMPAFTNIIPIKDFGAGEDYLCMLNAVQEHGGQGTYFQVGVDRTAGHHNDRFDFDEESLAAGAELAARVVAEYL